MQLPVSAKKACQIPDPVGKANTLDFTSHKQDVVQIAIKSENPGKSQRKESLD